MTQEIDPWVYSVAGMQDQTTTGVQWKFLVARHKNAVGGGQYDCQRLNASLEWDSVIDPDGRYIQFEDQRDPIIIPSVAVTAAPDVTADYLTNIAERIEDPMMRDRFISLIGLHRR